MKVVLKKCDDEYFALLTYKNTPLHNGYSQHSCVSGAFENTSAHSSCGANSTTSGPRLGTKEREKQYRATMAANYDRRHAVVERTPLSAGDRVLNLIEFFQYGSLIYRLRGTSSEIYNRHDCC